MEESRIRFLQTLEIVAIDLLLVADAPPGNPLEQYIDRCLQIDHEIGNRRVDGESGIDLLVQPVLFVVQGQARKQPILVEQIVRDAHCVEEIVLTDVFELTRALEEKEQLRRQRTRARIAIEALEERILLRLLQDQLAAEAAGQTTRKARLPDPDGPFDDDETMRRNYGRLL